VIILRAFEAEPVEFRVEPADTLKNGQVARAAEGFADVFSLHRVKVDQYHGHVKRKFKGESCAGRQGQIGMNSPFACIAVC
jgi:hypothetical protein